MLTLDKLEGQHEPWPGDEGDVDEPEDVAEEAGEEHLDVTEPGDYNDYDEDIENDDGDYYLEIILKL